MVWQTPCTAAEQRSLYSIGPTETESVGGSPDKLDVQGTDKLVQLNPPRRPAGRVGWAENKAPHKWPFTVYSTDVSLSSDWLGNTIQPRGNRKAAAKMEIKPSLRKRNHLDYQLYENVLWFTPPYYIMQYISPFQCGSCKYFCTHNYWSTQIILNAQRLTVLWHLTFLGTQCNTPAINHLRRLHNDINSSAITWRSTTLANCYQYLYCK